MKNYAKTMKLLIIFILTSIISLGQNKSIDSNQVYSTMNLETMAEYPGGTKAMFKYLSDSVMYKMHITKDESYILRPVYYKITINEIGKVINPKILRSSNVASVDSLVIKALKNMPIWKPASMNGEIIKQDINIPLRFEFKN